MNKKQFLGEKSEYDDALFAILPVPYERTVSYGKGTAKGPAAIIDASSYLELYDEELDCDAFYEAGIATLKPIKPTSTPEKMMDTIYETALKELANGKFLITLGGEHSISSPLIKAHKEKYPNLSVLQLDAHADLRNEYEGSVWSHASAMRRVVDMKVPLVQVGLRSLSDECIEVIKNEELKVFYAKDIVPARSDKWMDGVIESLSDEVYITFDIDVFDPSIIPATGTPEPGGMNWYSALKLLRKISEKKTVIGFDLVELAPAKEHSHSDFTAAKLVYKMIGYMLKGKR